MDSKEAGKQGRDMMSGRHGQVMKEIEYLTELKTLGLPLTDDAEAIGSIIFDWQLVILRARKRSDPGVMVAVSVATTLSPVWTRTAG